MKKKTVTVLAIEHSKREFDPQSELIDRMEVRKLVVNAYRSGYNKAEKDAYSQALIDVSVGGKIKVVPMKAFEDLVFDKHPIANVYPNSKQAIVSFDNGYGVSVLFGSAFYSNGIDSYEVAILCNDEICYTTSITDYVVANASKEKVSEIMKEVQKLT